MREARGLASITCRPARAVDRELDVEQPDDAERARDPARLLADLREHLLAERVRRQHAGRVARVDARLLDVLHDAGDPDVLAVAERVDVDLDRVLEEAVEKDRAGRPARRCRSRGVR